jgi:DNA (cytosine-5)-methyltransferase 1
MTLFTAVDAFCGAGGLSIGLRKAGFRIRLAFDIDKAAIATVEANSKYLDHPSMRADVRQVLKKGLLSTAGLKKGELDLLAGGPPCQGFSIQRTVGAEHDERNLLVDDYGDLIIQAMPAFFMLENVPGIGGNRGRSVLERFKQRMAREGYYCHESILDARDYGVPQRRRRYILIGELATDGCVVFKWPPKSRRKPPTVRDVIGHLPPPPAGGSDHPDFPGHRADQLSATNRARLQALKPGQGREHLPIDLLADCHRLSADRIGHRNVYGRMAWDDVAPTITARFDSFTRGMFGHPEQVRTISLYEGALLQTFPAGYRFTGSKVEVARQIGNAVPPALAAALGSALHAALTCRTSLR